jgi:hypothetical protein
VTPRALGLLLVAAGIAGLLSGLGGLPALPAALWLAAAVALVVLLWLRPPGRPARGQRLVATFLLGIMALAGAGPLEGVVPAALTAAAFLAVWWRDRRGWPLLAGGLLAAVALTGAAAAFAPAWNPAPLLLLGFAATFSLAYLLPASWGGGRRWALVPALFFTVMTVVVNDPARSLPGWLLPALLIVGGATMLLGVRRR